MIAPERSWGLRPLLSLLFCHLLDPAWPAANGERGALGPPAAHSVQQ